MQPEFNRSAPYYFGQMLKLAFLVILRLYHSRYSTVLDLNEVTHYLDMAVNLHRSMSTEKNDFHERATILLLDLRKIFENNQDLQRLEPTLKLKTRQSASLIHDAHWIWRDHYAARSIDTQQFGRPPRVLPSIVRYSPASGLARESSNSSDTYEQSASSGHHGNVEENPDSVIPDVVDSDFYQPPNQSEASSRLSLNHGEVDPLPNPLDMMYAFLDPNEEATELFYPPWELEIEQE